MGDCEHWDPMSDGVGRYPFELVEDVKTTKGNSVQVRPIRPDDDPFLTEFHEHLSAQSVYRRFFFMHPRLSAAETERFTHVDYVDRLALVAEHSGRLVAAGRYERLPGIADAEVALVVADEFQHHGIGTILLERLAEAAWKNGIAVFVAQTLSENRGMLEVFLKSGFHVTFATVHGTVNVRFPIQPDDTYRLACAGRRRTRHLDEEVSQQAHRESDSTAWAHRGTTIGNGRHPCRILAFSTLESQEVSTE